MEAKNSNSWKKFIPSMTHVYRTEGGDAGSKFKELPLSTADNTFGPRSKPHVNVMTDSRDVTKPISMAEYQLALRRKMCQNAQNPPLICPKQVIIEAVRRLPEPVQGVMAGCKARAPL